MSYISKDYGNVRIVSEGYEMIVQRFIEYNEQGWTTVRTFHRMSDDYAITNARNYAEALVEKLKETV
jgi:hypothetical protein